MTKSDHQELVRLILRSRDLGDGWRMVSLHLNIFVESMYNDAPALYEVKNKEIRLTDLGYNLVGFQKVNVENYYVVNTTGYNYNHLDKLREDFYLFYNINNEIIVMIPPSKMVFFVLKYGNIIKPITYLEISDKDLVLIQEAPFL
mgnify:FL=1